MPAARATPAPSRTDQPGGTERIDETSAARQATSSANAASSPSSTAISVRERSIQVFVGATAPSDRTAHRLVLSEKPAMSVDTDQSTPSPNPSPSAPSATHQMMSAAGTIAASAASTARLRSSLPDPRTAAQVATGAMSADPNHSALPARANPPAPGTLE